jgi:hypothetical protein
MHENEISLNDVTGILEFGDSRRRFPRDQWIRTSIRAAVLITQYEEEFAARQSFDELLDTLIQHGSDIR